MIDGALIKQFLELYGGSEEGIRIFQAPGRINLIGEHIDYNGGHVFPAALDMNTVVIARPNGKDEIRFAATDLPDRVCAKLDSLENYKGIKWGSYQCGVAYMLQREGYRLTGCDMLFHGTVPFGAGLSSSASIEVVTALCLAKLGGAKQLVMEDIAVLCQKAENEYVGMSCGIMDQFISAVGKKDHAIFLNCRTLEYEYVPLELGDYTIVITNTNAPHKLTDSQYNQRRSECERALAVINANGGAYQTLCEMGIAELESFRDCFQDEVLYRRARHCVTEEMRTILSLKYLSEGNLEMFGSLLKEANVSIRDDYEATGKELDAVFDIAEGIDGVIGSRMTGGGFGGCNISIVRKDKAEEFRQIMNEEYTKRIGYAPAFYQSGAGQGAAEVEKWR